MARKCNESVSRVICYLFMIPLLVFYGLILGGCTVATPGSNSLGLLTFITQTAQVSVGYFGTCVVDNSTESGSLACTTTIFRSLDDIKAGLERSASIDLPEEALDAAINYGNAAVLNLMIWAFFAFLLFLLMDLIHYTDKKRRRDSYTPEQQSKRGQRQQRYLMSAAILMWISTVLVFAATIATTQSGRALQASSLSNLSAQVGQASLALHWTILTLSLVIAIAWTVLRQRAKSASSGPLGAVGIGAFKPIGLPPPPRPMSGGPPPGPPGPGSRRGSIASSV